MSAQGWAHDPTHAAGGRNHHNSLRTLRARLRRREVARLLLAYGWRYGTGVRIAAELGVSEATVSRDIRRLWLETPLPRIHCPMCGTMRTLDDDDDEASYL